MAGTLIKTAERLFKESEEEVEALTEEYNEIFYYCAGTPRLSLIQDDLTEAEVRCERLKNAYVKLFLRNEAAEGRL